MILDDILRECHLCPRSCGADRTKGPGWCGGGMLPKLALVSLHPWEEPVIAGEAPADASNTDKHESEYNSYGAGTVFFSGCNLRCIYCQNHEISHGGRGQEVSIERLAEIFIEQQKRGARTLDLVTPTHYVLQIIKALDIAKAKGLTLPVVYNSSGYEAVETIKMLDGYVDVFLPDLKYFSSEASGLYSATPDYFERASRAIACMLEIAGQPVVENGIMKKGVLVRHMVLPGLRRDSMRLLEWLWRSFGPQVYISIMNQYTPLYKALDEAKYKKLARRVTSFEYDSVVDYAYEIGFRHCFVQERRAASREYVPDWNGAGVLHR